ncbi:MAG: HDOD domain-containing protein, partial [Thermodesulfobacteriota bacterium]
AQKFSNLKTLPQVALKVTELAADENSTMYDFEEVIRLDPVLVSRLLRLVNSPYFGLVQKVESISRALVFTGMKQLRNLVALESLGSFFKGGEDREIFSKDLWLYSVTVAILAEMIARRIFGRQGEDVFLAGIIHDIGFIVEDQVVGDKLREACGKFYRGEASLTECEREAIGADHTEVGFIIAGDWNLSAEILESIRSHHLEHVKGSLASISSILQLAGFMAAKMNYWPVPGPVASLPPVLARHVKEKVLDYKIILRDLPGEMAKAKELYDID